MLWAGIVAFGEIFGPAFGRMGAGVCAASAKGNKKQEGIVGHLSVRRKRQVTKALVMSCGFEWSLD